MITDRMARTISLQYRTTETLRLFAKTGDIPDVEDLRYSISVELQQLDVGEERRELLALDRYVRSRSNHGEQVYKGEPWHLLEEDTTKPGLGDV